MEGRKPEKEIMVALPLVHSFNWNLTLGQRLQSIRRAAHDGQFADRRDLAKFLVDKGIQCSDSKLKRLEIGIAPKVEKTFLDQLLEVLGSSFEHLLEQKDQPVQLKAPEK